MSPVVERKITALYFFRVSGENWLASSVAVMVRLWSEARDWRAWMPTGMESWRNPAVFEKTRMGVGWSWVRMARSMVRSLHAKDQLMIFLNVIIHLLIGIGRLRRGGCE